MKDYRNSDYALNKFAKGIVYRFTDKTVEVMQEDYLAENPGKTAADFKALKAESDGIYLAQDREDTALGKKQLSLTGLEDAEVCSVPGTDYAVIEEPDKAERKRKRRELGKQALGKLTEVQRRRYVMYHAGGLTTRQIAEREGTAQRTIMDSLEQAEKKIKKFLAKS
jgi:RNA polymerase sigma factor (sigma-70 family)